MKITLDRIDDAFHFHGSGAAGITVQIDGGSATGGHDQGARPMELLLMALGGCSAFDVVSILKKQRQDLQNLRVEVTGERVENEIPKVFRKIHMHFIFSGDIDAQKADRAILLSVEKYCSVHAMLEKTVEITHSFEIAV